MQSVWDQGDAYEPYVGRWSRMVGERFLDWLALPAGLYWMDVGCGTGALMQKVLERCAPARVVGVEPSEGYLAVARQQVDLARAFFEQGEAARIPVEDAAVQALVSGLVLNFVADKDAALAEMRRVVRPGGTVAAYIWDYAGRMELMRYFWDAAAALDPAAAALDEGVRFPIADLGRLEALFRSVGLKGVDSRAIDVPTVFSNFEDYWTPFLGGQFPAPDYCMSLDEERREALRKRLLETLPVAADGTISLNARALAVKGEVP